MKTHIPPFIIKACAYVAIIFAALMMANGVWTAFQAYQMEATYGKMKEGQAVIVGQTAQKAAYAVEIALTPNELSKGLMYREKLDEGRGMLFIHNRVQELNMWMKNTKIPLDMLFIDNGGQIIHMVENARPFDERVISSHYPARAVLEIRAGEVQARGIAVGDRLLNSYFGNAGE